VEKGNGARRSVGGAEQQTRGAFHPMAENGRKKILSPSTQEKIKKKKKKTKAGFPTPRARAVKKRRREKSSKNQSPWKTAPTLSA